MSTGHSAGHGRPSRPRHFVLGMMWNMLPSMVINAACPAVIYLYLKMHFPGHSIVPIGVAALFPLFGNLLSIAKNRSLDMFGSMMLLGFAITLVIILIGGDEKVILVSRSLLTLVVGLVCLLSLLLPRTVSFYFARQFATANDRTRVMQFDQLWQRPYVRFVSRITSFVWGLALVAEFLIRATIVYSLPVTQVLVLTPMVFNAISMSTMAWTVMYGTRAVKRIRREATDLQSVGLSFG